MDRRCLLNDSEEGFRLAFEGKQSSLWSAMPGVITEVDLVENTCTVQPAIQGIVEHDDGTIESVNLPVLIHVPIVFPRAGNFILTLPLTVGDEVLVVFGSRCIDAWWQQGGIQRPAEMRMHDLSDGFAIPGPASQPKKVSNISSTEAQLRSLDGTTYLSIAPGGKIKMIAPGGVEVTGNMVVSGEVTANNIPLSTHKHIGVTTGGGTSGGPTI